MRDNQTGRSLTGNMYAQQQLGVDGNQVLQKAYRLLGLSFIPCAAGAAIPYYTGFNIAFLSGGIGLLVIMAIFYGLIFMINKNRYNNLGVALLMGFTFLMGIMLGSYIQLIQAVAANGSKAITMAAAMTATIFIVMSIIAPKVNIAQRPFAAFMITGAIVLMASILLNHFFFKLPAMHMAIDVAFVLFSSAGIVYETKRALDWGDTSHISIALGLFIHIYNLFTALLSLLSDR